MKLQTVILNYKTPDMTLKAAEALMAATETLPDARLAIVDNDSQDGSFEKLRDAVAARPWKSRAEVLQSGHNGGFGAGNNFGGEHKASTRLDRNRVLFILIAIHPGKIGVNIAVELCFFYRTNWLKILTVGPFC
jgi:GT2 family glycosyltransferase